MTDMDLLRENGRLRKRVEELERERDRFASGLRVLATTFFKEDQHQEYARHCVEERISSANGTISALKTAEAKP